MPAHNITNFITTNRPIHRDDNVDRGRIFGQLLQARGLGKPFMISFIIDDYSFDYIFLLGVLVTVR